METYPDRFPSPTNAFSGSTSGDVTVSSLGGMYSQRSNTTRTLETYPIQLFFCNREADYAFFLRWFSETINEGNDWFYIPLPIDNGFKTVKARFVGGAYSTSRVEYKTWSVTATLEYIPTYEGKVINA